MQFRPSQSVSAFLRPGRAFWPAVCLLVHAAVGCGSNGTIDDEATEGTGGDGGDHAENGGGPGGGSGGASGQGSEVGGRPTSTFDGGSNAGGTGGGSSSITPDAGAGDVSPLPLKPALVAAGYGGIRVMSFDGGKTWKNRVVLNPNGGDDDNLIRAISYVEGLWVAVGWKAFLSEDGINWTEINDATLPGGWYDCATSKAGRLILKTIRADRGGQNGEAIYSDDRGKTWTKANFPTQCYAQTDSFSADGISLRSSWKGKIDRSANGGPWQTVLTDCCSVVMFAKGMAVEK